MADSKDIDKTGQKVDAAFFHAEDAPDDGRPHWAAHMISVEFKSRLDESNQNDPYDDTLKDGSADATAASRKGVRGQITTYSELVHAVQHRTCLFMVLILGRRFRLMRWDRAGTIVTSSVDYFEDPDALCDFLWRGSHLCNEALGVDPSAIRLSEDCREYKAMDDRAKPHTTDVDCSERLLTETECTGEVTYSYVRKLFADSIKGDWPRYKLRVPFEDGWLWFYVGKPLFIAPGMAGRGTRGWVGWDPQGKRFVFIKDSWRADYEELELEGTILRKLNQAGVPNVPTLVCHGDIDEQTTRTAKWWEEKNPARAWTQPYSQSVVGRMKRKRESASNPPPETTNLLALYANRVSFRHDCPIRNHRHYRMFTKEVCMRLESTRGTPDGIPFFQFQRWHCFEEEKMNPKAAHGKMTSSSLSPLIQCAGVQLSSYDPPSTFPFRCLWR